MLQLNIEQVEALMALQRRRDLQQLASLLAQAFPQPAARLGARLADLVELGTQRGQAHGLRHALGLARYLACWFVLGAEFEARPGQEWARLLLQDTGRTEGAKVFQLSRRAREALARQAPPGPGMPATLDVAGWDSALQTLDAALRDRGPFGGLQRGPRLALGQPCDIDAIAIRLDPAERQSYQFEHGQWTRARRTVPAAVLRVALDPALQASPAAGQGPAQEVLPALPPRLWLLAPAVAGAPARLQLRCAAQACCDPQTHPLVSYNAAGRVREWRGPHASQPALEATAVPPDTPADGPAPMIAQASLARLGQIGFAACGLRDQGPAIGTAGSELVVLPVEQHLMVWRREAPAPWRWSEAETPAPALSRTRLRIERDGHLLDASAWQAGWDGLDRQFIEGLERLFGAWRRGNGLERCTLEASPQLLTGDAGLTWGWQEAEQPLSQPPAFRLKARLMTMACALDLALGGEIELLGGRARLRLQAQAGVPLQAETDALASEAPLLPDTAPLQVEFMLPFVLAAEALATAEAALLHTGAATGGVVGACGLRPRPDGAGLQWFARLEVEPVQALLHVESPWLGRSSVFRTLLPAMPLLDWSLG